MALQLPHPIDSLGVLAVHGAQRSMHPILGRWHENQMNVIRHEAIGSDFHFLPSRVGVQKAQVGLLITIHKEYWLAMISALSDVMRNAWKDRSSLSGHVQKLLDCR